MAENEIIGSLDDKKPSDSLPLDVLKALHEASAVRWEKRRDYEWKLSSTFWTALAGFIATVLFGKDSRFESPGSGKMMIWLGLVFLFHAYYLGSMVDRTLGDLKAQTEIEKAINALSPKVDPKYLGAGMDGRSWFAQRYGIWSQLGITFSLCLTAWWFSTHRAPVTPPAPATPGVSVSCPAPQTPQPVEHRPASPHRPR